MGVVFIYPDCKTLKPPLLFKKIWVNAII